MHLSMMSRHQLPTVVVAVVMMMTMTMMTMPQLLPLMME
jgi:hypothetical protein